MIRIVRRREEVNLIRLRFLLVKVGYKMLICEICTKNLKIKNIICDFVTNYFICVNGWR